MLNTVAILGRLVRDPELKHTQNDVAVTSFTLAVESGWGEKKTAHFLDVVAWRHTAEFVCKYFQKGQQMAVSGSLQTRSWEDKDGNKRKAVEIVASDISFCGSKEQKDNSYDKEPQTQPDRAPVYEEPRQQKMDDMDYFTSDDDLPF